MDDFFDTCPDYYVWPNGSDVFVEVLRKYLPGVTLPQMRPLVYALLGHPGLDKCADIKSQADSDFVLKTEGTALALQVQAYAERAQCALNVTKNPTAIANLHRCVRLIRSQTHYLPGGALDA
jgi:hypothetical protein